MDRSGCSLIFLGQRNFFTEFLVDWLAKTTPTLGVIWTASERHKVSAKLRRLRGRVRRGGILRASSEVSYYLASKVLYHEDAGALRVLVENCRTELGISATNLPSITVPNLKDKSVLPFLREKGPALLLTQCINEKIPAEVYRNPELGCFVLHEGIVPHYRGKFCTHWAILNGDFDQIGVSLLRVEEGWDRGPAAFVERLTPTQTLGRGHGFLEHDVLLRVLPRLEHWFQGLPGSALDLIPQVGPAGVYSYPTFTHLFRAHKAKLAYVRASATPPTFNPTPTEASLRASTEDA